MNSSAQILKLNLLPPEKLYCDFKYWSSLFTLDMQIIWDKTMNRNKLGGIGLDYLLNLWFDKYSLNKNGYFQLTSPTIDIKINNKELNV